MDKGQGGADQTLLLLREGVDEVYKECISLLLPFSVLGWAAKFTLFYSGRKETPKQLDVYL